MTQFGLKVVGKYLTKAKANGYGISRDLKCVHVVGLQLLQHGRDKNVAWLVHWASVNEKQEMVIGI